MKKFLLLTALVLPFFLLPQDNAYAAPEKSHPQIKNHPDVYSTKPDLPADVPYTNQRNRDWLGGYLNDTNENDVNNDDGTNDGSASTSPQHRRRDGQHRKWRRHH
jgi:hypothetical protein